MQNVISLHPTTTPFAAVARDAFADALTRISKVVELKAKIPILAAVKLESVGDRLTITGTNLDIEMRIAIPVAAGSTDMAVVITLDQLRGFIKISTGELIRITSNEEGDKAKIICGASEMEIDVFDPNDFPEPVDFEKKGAEVFEISPGVFHNGICAVLPAVSTEETRYYLNGAFMEAYEGGLRMVATDGHRLHYRDMPVEGRMRLKGTHILPTALLGVLKACVEPKSYGYYMRVTCRPEQRLIRFSLTDMLITAKTIDGQYVDYQRVLPREAVSNGTVKAAHLSQFLRSVGKAHAIKLDFTDGECSLAASIDGVLRSTKIAASLEGEPVCIGFNRAYLLAAIDEASPAGGRVTIGIFSPDTVAGVSGTERQFRAALMPMRV